MIHITSESDKSIKSAEIVRNEVIQLNLSCTITKPPSELS